MEALDLYWQDTVAAWPYNEQSFCALFLTSAFIVGYWIPNFFLFFWYKFELFPSWRIPGNDEKFPSAQLIRDCLIHNVIHTVLIQPVIGYFVLSRLYEGKTADPLPSLFTAIGHIAICFFFADGSFYWLHRTAHHRLLYKRFHKQHHMFKATIGIAANYASMGEDLFVNVLSTLIGPLVIGYFGDLHITTLFAYLALRYQESVEEHSGYDIKFSPWRYLRNNAHHNYHHTHNIGSYGTFPFWDWAMGTDKSYRAHMAKINQIKRDMQSKSTEKVQQ